MQEISGVKIVIERPLESTVLHFLNFSVLSTEKYYILNNIYESIKSCLGTNLKVSICICDMVCDMVCDMHM